MADNRFMNTSAAEATQVDLGLRSYMLGVYNHMTTALLMTDRKSTRLNSSHSQQSRMPSSA